MKIFVTRKNLGSESWLYQFFIYMLRWENSTYEWVDEMKGVLIYQSFSIPWTLFGLCAKKSLTDLLSDILNDLSVNDSIRSCFNLLKAFSWKPVHL